MRGIQWGMRRFRLPTAMALVISALLGGGWIAHAQTLTMSPGSPVVATNAAFLPGIPGTAARAAAM